MKNSILAFILIHSSLSFSQIQELKTNSDAAREKIEKKVIGNQHASKYVNTFVGTGGHGHTFPGPVLPFGMVQVGPDTRYEGWDGCGGYHYSDSVIYGFSHTHLSGTGIPDYSDVLLVPQQGKLNTVPGYKKAGGFGSVFRHEKEKATPGYYHVEMEDGITADLTASLHCALHRYRFSNPKGKRYIIIDLGYRDRVLEVGAQKTSATTVTGKRVSEAWAVHQHLAFSLETSIPFTKTKWIEDKEDGNYLFVMEFPEGVKEISVRVAISGTDEPGATENLKELPNFDFDYVLGRATAAWDDVLGRIYVKSTQKEVLTNFYTALYHTYVHPSLWTDINGRYRDYNDQIQKSETKLYSVFSLWDTYRGANPLYTITQPEKVVDFVNSFYQQYKNTGLLPVWTLSNNETNCMIGYHSVSVITDAYLKGIPLENPEGLLEAMIASSTADQWGKKQYEEIGFISANTQAESVSKTLEYAYDDWCISKFAEKLGKADIAKKYEIRSANWMNLMHPESRFFQPRKDGIFLPFFKPNEVNHHFTEANGWQYSLAAPHHMQTLIDMHGGNEGMVNFLDSMFLGSSTMSGREQADITGLIGQYAHGNEPSHHMAYTYNYCGAPEKTQFLIDTILKTFYTNNPDGLSGNEDCGQMSAWYVLSSMGFYPVSPGSPTYAIGRPMMDKVMIHGEKKDFEINTLNNSIDNKFVQSISWNGAAYQKLFITHEMIKEGGILEISMGPKPNRQVASYELDLRNEVSPAFVPVPFFTTSQTMFETTMELGIDVLFFEKGKVYYSFDGTKYQPFYKQGGKNIQLNETSHVYAKVVREDGSESKVIKTLFTKYIRDKKITLSTEYANQYSGGGAQALVDGQKGTEEYRGTEWQGTFGKDVQGVIELNETKEISMIQFSYLQDQKSWIFPPKEITVEVSTDGVSYRKLGKVQGVLVKEGDGLKIGEIDFEIAPTSCKFIRFNIENYGPCPSWHLGVGNPTWLFLDEITVK